MLREGQDFFDPDMAALREPLALAVVGGDGRPAALVGEPPLRSDDEAEYWRYIWGFGHEHQRRFSATRRWFQADQNSGLTQFNGPHHSFQRLSKRFGNPWSTPTPTPNSDSDTDTRDDDLEDDALDPARRFERFAAYVDPFYSTWLLLQNGRSRSTAQAGTDDETALGLFMEVPVFGVFMRVASFAFAF